MTTNTITRFDIFDRKATDDGDEMTVVRLFEKRKLLGELDVEDCSRYPDGFDNDDFAAWIFEQTRKGHAPTLTQAMDYLGEEPGNDSDEEERDGGSIVPQKYRIKYGAPQNCGDEIALALTDFVTLPRATKKDADGGLDRAKLRAVAETNNIGDKLANWEERDLNGGLLRMNTSNVLRGMHRRGEAVTIGDKTWPAREVPKKERKSRAKGGTKAKAPKAKPAKK